jgi:hypothetical protein
MPRIAKRINNEVPPRVDRRSVLVVISWRNTGHCGSMNSQAQSGISLQWMLSLTSKN